MNRHILITGGAGFIGSHLADQLLARGHRVRVLDALVEQVHGASGDRPVYLHDDVELIRGDVRDRDKLRQALDGVEVVYHLAAAVGVGQSMYEVADYTGVNNLGTAVLMEELAQREIDRLVIASSMSIYGEGLYQTPAGATRHDASRTLEQMQAGQWEPRAEGESLTPVPTPESKQPDLASIYALSKFDQERMGLMLGKAYGIPAVALRFFNVFGPRQALSNPYTGVLAIFASRLLNNRPPRIFEDGEQQRDFVSVHDIARACVLAMESGDAPGEVLNIGSGRPRTIRQVAEALAEVMGRADVQPEVTGEYRVGDIRHCFADISRARSVLGYQPEVSFAEGLTELADWLGGQAAQDRVDQAHAELAARGLTV
ncbi:MAG: NAD-dependent epimerase/dehydratase family protein [Phycisphaeraceae bacterium]